METSPENSFESLITDETFALSRQGSDKTRAKTSQRLKYEAETQVFKREMGGLEQVRIKLGLSKRKICQLLLVDPSAWSRWTTEDADAPPHIYRSLKWYLDSKSFQMGQVEATLTKVLTENADLKSNVKTLQKQTRILSFILGVLIVSGVLSALFKLLF
jgi:hypothetical protein